MRREQRYQHRDDPTRNVPESADVHARILGCSSGSGKKRRRPPRYMTFMCAAEWFFTLFPFGRTAQTQSL